jgi:(E)-4-hydroxy-3-methylbut-2-enyl-diphosphate synthase
VRVELGLGAVPEDPEAAADALDASLALLPEVDCEGLCLDVHDEPDHTRLRAYADALSARGRALPIAVRAESRMAVASADAAARLVVAAGALIENSELEAVARCAAGRRIPVEWELRGVLAEVPALVDRALEASRRGGLEDLAISVDAEPFVQSVRLAAARLRARGAADVPIVLRHRRHSEADDESALLDLAASLGAPLCDGIGDAIAPHGFRDPARAVDLAYRVLQGARLRTSRTEFISCPSCGRTLFDLEETTARIKERTGHLVGLKIAVMGCIVNGPGEMADADFGYVGSGPGTVNLFVGHECIERHVPSEHATDRLVELIRSHGRWVEPAGD